MEKTYDIFGIETDASIDREAKEKKKLAYEKRRAIIDGDILTYLNNYTMLDNMSFQPTKAKKKEYIVNYLMREIPLVRKGADHYGKYYFAYVKEYKDKPVDKEMCEKMALYILDTYKHENGVKYQRVRIDNNSYYHIDKNGVEVEKTEFENHELYKEYLKKIFRKEYPIETHKSYYSTDGKTELTQYASEELKDRARELAKKDSKWVILKEVD